ncbi:MAG: energy transducer TonB [Steroidobacteraceae bacterium]
MPKSLRKHELSAPQAPHRPVVQSVKNKQKLGVLLVTGDEALWPQIGADLGAGLILKQLDSIDELIASIPAGEPGIVLWDARHRTDAAAVLSRMHLHSSRFAVVALDDAINAGAWTAAIQRRQVVAHVALPIAGDSLAEALMHAHEEVNARLALLGDESPRSAASVHPKKTWLLPAIIAGALAAAAAAYMLTRTGVPQTKTAAPPSSVENKAAAAPTAGKSAAEADEQVDSLVEKAQRAMLDRHYIDPAAGSALSLYREVLIIDPDNGEALQGLQRLSEILIARVQSALDERKYDVALQSLETARSINASDRRVAALDKKIADLRAEFGPAQIMAALNAQNFDRAAQLIDDAARAKSLPPAKLAQLREEVRRQRFEFDAGHLLKLVDARLQQDHLIDPHNDSAVYYLDQAKRAGADAAELQAATQEVLKRLAQMAHTGIEQRHFSDVERTLAEMHGLGAAAATIAGLQRELGAARSQAAQKADQTQFLELAQTRLAQGKLLEPDNDSALYYLNQLRSADAKNSAIPQLSSAVQVQILERANSALGAGDLPKSESLAQLAAEIGGSPELDAFKEKLRQRIALLDDLPQVQEGSLTRINKLDVAYPTRAYQDNVEGWVELGYTVAANGSVANVKILNSQPANFFEEAATKAVSRLRYKPVLTDGKPIAVRTTVRIVFRVPK